MMTGQTSPQGLIFVTARNCASYVPNCIRSLGRQTNRHFQVLFVDDGSIDGTADVAEQELAQVLPGRYESVRNQTCRGKARNAYELLPTRSQVAFVAILDGDDQLIDDHVIEDFAQAYSRGYDAVWTNYRTDRGNIGCNGSLDPFVSPRLQEWRTSHLFSFRRCLLDAVDESYFQEERGEWLMSACDRAIAYSVLDQTRRYLYLPRISYQYTETNPNSHHNLDPASVGVNSSHQRRNARVVLLKTPLPCTRRFQVARQFPLDILPCVSVVCCRS